MNEGEVALISIGASVASGCRHCLDVHVQEARRWGVPVAEMRAAMDRALEVRESSLAIMAKLGSRLLKLKRIGHGNGTESDGTSMPEGDSTRMSELVAIASAFAVNCDASLERHLEAARKIGVPDTEIEKALDIARFVKGRADSLCCKWI